MMQIDKKFTVEMADEMIKQVDVDGDKRISKMEFQQLMFPKLLDEIVAQEDTVEDLRAKFREADVDYSGFLEIDEFYVCLTKMGAMVSRQEVIDLFSEFDADQSGQIDIDEFVDFMQKGD
jgi:Ca2+-binding EF-hand superfamily protein